MTTTTPASGTVLPLAAATDHRIAGRKAATLARLAAAGFPVPPGVVVPAAVPERAPGPELDVPADVAADLLDAVRGWGDVPLAVRSSGVDEDGAAASYAGLFTSVLDVHGDSALLDAVRECWRSAFDARVTSYAGSQPRGLAVLVQPMVAAGAAFTADPVTAGRMRGHPEDSHPAGGVLDDEEAIQAGEGHRLQVEQVAGEDPAGLRGEELRPGRTGPARRGAGSRPAAVRIRQTVEAPTR